MVDKKKCSGVITVKQFMYDPTDYIYERDSNGKLLDGFPKLKDNAKPLLTLERMKAFAQKFDDTKEIAWILHDKDVYTESDEDKDKTGLVRAGEPEPAHFHIILRSRMSERPNGPATRRAIRLYTVSRGLGVPMESIRTPKGKAAFPKGLVDLIHASEHDKAIGKYQYGQGDVHANFEWWPIVYRYINKNEKALGKGLKFGKWVDQLDPHAKNYELTLWSCAVLYDGVPLEVVKERMPILFEAHVMRFIKNRERYLENEANPMW